LDGGIDFANLQRGKLAKSSKTANLPP
jgi:hypothetical protein